MDVTIESLTTAGIFIFATWATFMVYKLIVLIVRVVINKRAARRAALTIHAD